LSTNLVKDIVRNKTYMILLLTIGGGIGLYSTIATLLEQFLCPYGYSDVSFTLVGIGVLFTSCVTKHFDLNLAPLFSQLPV